MSGEGVNEKVESMVESSEEGVDDKNSEGQSNSEMKESEAMDTEASSEPILDVSAILEKGNTPTQIGLEFDVGNLLVASYQEQPKNFNQIDVTQQCLQSLFENIFNLPVKASDAGPLALLPDPVWKIPREKHVPEPKPETKWEKFAKEKGIQKKKKGRKVWDKTTDEWKPRWGKGRINDPKEDWLLEDNPQKLEASGVKDPFELKAKEKKEKSMKQKKAELSNIRRAQAQRNSLPSTIDITSNAPRREKYSLERAVTLAQKSTASMGKFDKLASDEPKIKSKPKYGSNNPAAEHQTNLKIMERVIKNTDSKVNVGKAVNNFVKKEQQTNSKKRKRK